MHRSGLLVLVLCAAPCRAEAPELFREKPFTCVTLANAVNHFVALGEKEAVKELLSLPVGPFSTPISEVYIDENERIGWVCRILFQPKGKAPLRNARFGCPQLHFESMPPERWPHFPIARSGSSFFVVSQGYVVGGRPESTKSYIDYCAKEGVFRKDRIPVPTRKQALEDLESLRKSEAWKKIKWSEGGQEMEKYFWDFFIKAQAEGVPEKGK